MKTRKMKRSVMNPRMLRQGTAVWVLAVLLIAVQSAADEAVEPSRVSSHENAASRHERVVEHLKATGAEISARSLSDIQSLDDWKEKRPSIRRELLYMLGLDPLPARTPLNAEITGTLERTDYRVEKVVYQSLPGLYVTGNFYLPRNSAPPLATVLYVCGHSPHPLGAKWNYQDRAAWFAEHGYACLILDTLEFGEVPGIHHGIHDLNLWNWLSLGYTPAGVEVWNAIRAIDYLESRPEVDKSRIGMTGISGGGAVTWFTAAVDERIAAVVPVCLPATRNIASNESVRWYLTYFAHHFLAHPRAKHCGYAYRTVCQLMVLHDGDDRSADRNGCSIERMD